MRGDDLDRALELAQSLLHREDQRRTHDLSHREAADLIQAHRDKRNAQADVAVRERKLHLAWEILNDQAYSVAMRNSYAEWALRTGQDRRLPVPSEAQR